MTKKKTNLEFTFCSQFIKNLTQSQKFCLKPSLNKKIMKGRF